MESPLARRHNPNITKRGKALPSPRCRLTARLGLRLGLARVLRQRKQTARFQKVPRVRLR